MEKIDIRDKHIENMETHLGITQFKSDEFELNKNEYMSVLANRICTEIHNTNERTQDVEYLTKLLDAMNGLLPDKLVQEIKAEVHLILSMYAPHYSMLFESLDKMKDLHKTLGIRIQMEENNIKKTNEKYGNKSI